jgi:endonuclease/exonuclease/phosphatase family metal-dependent hydrolase
MSTIKVLTFNMQFGQTWDDADPDNARVDLERCIEELRTIDADIVLLQEVERVEPRLGQVQPPPNYARLIRALPHYDGFFSYPPADPRELPFGYGLAILSKTRLFDTCAVPLPAPDLEFHFKGERTQPTQRVLMGARTRVDGHVLQLFNTHLQAFFIINENSDEHPAQRAAVSARLRASELPTLLGGDFNAAPGEGTIDQIEGAGYKTVQRDEITWRRMPYVLDHIFYNNQLEALQHEIIETDASDHKMLVADFAFARGSRRRQDSNSPFANAEVES